VPGQPLPDSSVDGKFIDCCRARFASERTASLLESLRNLETVSSMRAVGAMLAADES
jgi:hypothetical protein